MKTGGKVAIGVTAGVALIATAAFLAQKSGAADKLKLDFSSVDIALRGQGEGILSKLPTKVRVSITFNAVNPVNTELKFTAPFVELTVPNKQGVETSLGHSTPSSEEIIIPARGTKAITVTVDVPLFTMLTVFPDYVQYAWGRTHGEPSTRQLKAKYSYTAYGFNQSAETPIAI